MAAEPDFSRDALARFIDYVVDKNLVNPSTAQGWRVATTKVLAELTPEERTDVRRIEVDATFKQFLNRNPGRLSPASTGEYRRRVGRAIDEFVSWMENPAGYGSRTAAWTARSESRPRSRPRGSAPPASAPALERSESGGVALSFPVRPGFLAHVVVPADLTVDEARRMGAFLLTLAPDFRPT
jgi:hypothetical protein